MMKRIYIILLLGCAAGQLMSQVEVTIPTPNALTIQKYGNTDVSMYTGAVNVTIPLVTAKSRGLNLPVSLNYSASNGIKVEEVSSWVGIGWTLNAGGAVSRVIRGRVDDGSNGFTSLPALPSSISEFPAQDAIDIASGIKDGEPDKFFYNASGISGSFFLQKDGSILQKPLTDNKIIPKYGRLDNEGTGKLLVGTITGFDVISPDGTKYSFEEHEYSNTRPLGNNNWTDNTFKVSSWYLTEISHPSHGGVITLSYTTNRTFLHTESVSNKITPTGFVHSYIRTETYAKQLSEIVYEGGKLVFVPGQNRCDFKDNKILEGIEVRDNANALLKKHTFDYSYFTETGTEELTAPCATNIYVSGSNYDGDYRKRLRLNKVTEWDGALTESIEVALFEYEQSNFLPSRHSKARDHWGFYNGQLSNTSLEPAYAKYVPLPGGNFGWITGGTANREPSETHAGAGMLNKITHKTGGFTEFTYEGNEIYGDEVICCDLLDGSNETILIEDQPYVLNTSPSGITPVSIKVDLRASVTGTSRCGLKVIFTNTSTNVIQTITLANSTGVLNGMANLVPGNYNVKYQKIDNTNGCWLRTDVFIDVSWDYLVANIGFRKHEKVGGLRVQSITDKSDESDVGIVRNFEYQDELENTNSSGALVNKPEYGYILPVDISSQHAWIQVLYPFNWVRTYHTNQPLAITKGSHVGYARVVEKQIDLSNTDKGITEYRYTTAKEYPDIQRGWTNSSGDDIVTVGNFTFKTWVFPQINSEEWKRGLLLSKKDYRSEVSGSKMVNSLENSYNFLDSELILGRNGLISGVKVENDMALAVIFVKFFELNSGRHELKTSTNKRSTSADENLYVTTTTTNKYEGIGHLSLTSQTQTNSDNLVQETQYRYPEDYTSPSYIIDTMISKNMVGVPIEQIRKVGSQVISVLATEHEYIASDDLLVPKHFYAYEPSTLETNPSYSSDGTTFNSYTLKQSVVKRDNKGNILELPKENDIHICYIWGYNKTLPIAQTVNAGSDEVAFSSWEDGYSGDWTVSYGAKLIDEAVTGTQSMKLSFGVELITRKVIPTGTYLLSLYAKNTNGTRGGALTMRGTYPIWPGDTEWQYNERVITLQQPQKITLIPSVHMLVDEIRLLPVDAQMTTYTYDPLVGMTSQTDPNGVTTYYEYDDFGRLKSTTDAEGNTVQQINYNYKN